MNKLIGISVGAAMFLAPIAAMAAVSVDTLLVNGKANDVVAASATVKLDVNITSDGANDIESLFVKFPGSGGASEQGKCYDVADQLAASPVNGWPFSLDVVAPSNNGPWTVEISTHGTDGEPADQTCSTSADDTTSFGGRITVTGSTASTSTGNSTLDALIAQVNAIAALVAKLVAAPTPPAGGSASAACTALAPFASLYQGATGSQVGQLQGFLLYKGMSIPLLQNNQASYGYFGSQTAAALSMYKAQNGCY